MGTRMTLMKRMLTDSIQKIIIGVNPNNPRLPALAGTDGNEFRRAGVSSAFICNRIINIL